MKRKNPKVCLLKEIQKVAERIGEIEIDHY
jgi:hypothetical protein